MKDTPNTLNEEIKRMKSLFTEERLYGNLVEQEEETFEMYNVKKGKSKKYIWKWSERDKRINCK